MRACAKCNFRWDPSSIADKDGPDDCRECEANRFWNLVVQLEHDVETARDEAREFLGEAHMPCAMRHVVQVLVKKLRKMEAKPS